MNSFLKNGETKAEKRSIGFPVFITEIPCRLINHGFGSLKKDFYHLVDKRSIGNMTNPQKDDKSSYSFLLLFNFINKKVRFPCTFFKLLQSIQ